jgi:hypothetical protein
MDPKLQWSWNVGGNDDVQFQIPRSSRAALSLIDDQWCSVPSYYNTGRGAWEQRSTVQVAIFVPSSSNNRIQLILHDPQREQRSTSYQIEINDAVSRMQFVPLPPGSTQPFAENSVPHHSNEMEAFGVLLVLATSDIISVFSLVFTSTKRDDNFTMSECVEVSSDTKNTAAFSQRLKDRRVQEMKSQLVFIPRKMTNDGLCKDAALLVVTSSLKVQANFDAKVSSPHAVDAFVFPLKNHDVCPVFQYSTTEAQQQQSRSLNLLKGKQGSSRLSRFMKCDSKLTGVATACSHRQMSAKFETYAYLVTPCFMTKPVWWWLCF